MIHPEIAKYWRSLGREIFRGKVGSIKECWVYFDHGRAVSIVAEATPEGIQYYFSVDNETVIFNEEQALRFIQLKAFW